MIVFLELIQKLLPLMAFVGMGWIAGKKLKIERESIAKLILFLVAPGVFFTNLALMDFQPVWFLAPLVMLSLGTAVGSLILCSKKWIYPHQPAQRTLLAFSAGTANAGYFGLPIAMMFFGDEIIGMTIIFFITFILFENTIGFYWLNEGKIGKRHAIEKLLRLPAVYAMLAGLLFHLLPDGARAALGSYLHAVNPALKGSYTFLGMLLVGMGVSQFEKLVFDSRFVLATSFLRLFFMPAAMVGFVVLDRTFFHVFDDSVQKLMVLLFSCPVAANTVAYSLLAKVAPEKAATAVLFSTVLSVLTIPLWYLFAICSNCGIGGSIF